MTVAQLRAALPRDGTFSMPKSGTLSMPIDNQQAPQRICLLRSEVTERIARQTIRHAPADESRPI